MYMDLLTRALGNGEEGHRSDDLLRADLLLSRARLHDGCGTIPVAEALAREVSYDGALIRLCRSLGVPTAPGRFAQPVRERARLEHALLRHGFALSSGAAQPQLQPV
jgi:hypothetical protein